MACSVIVLLLCSVSAALTLEETTVLTGVGKRMSAMIREHFNRRQDRRAKQICYDDVGCFRKGGGPLSRTPQSPEELDTRFEVFGRDRIDPGLPTVLVIHGYKGSSKDPGARSLVHNLLHQKEQNVVLLDWEKGAKGPSYTLSAANTQLVGRQLALFIQDMVTLGVPAERIHVIGFSLGAHIAGYAGRALKQNGIFIGRITGLDPASPLFRENIGSTLSALGKEDAALVDVLHTDGAALWTSGFGLLKPLGDVDFFPNGGQDQPGCAHIRASVIVSQLEGTVNSSVVCNHARGFRLFLESTDTDIDCLFRAFPCPSRESFQSASCFPSHCNLTDGSCGLMGYGADQYPARGPLYLVTRENFPFCGDQLQVLVKISPRIKRTRGKVQLFLLHSSEEITEFNLIPEVREVILGGSVLKALSTAKFESMDPSRTSNITALVTFRSHEGHRPLLIDYAQISDLDGNRWSFCQKETRLFDIEGAGFDSARINLALGAC